MKKEFTMSLYANKESLEKDKEEFLSRCAIIVHDHVGYVYTIPYVKLKDWKECCENGIIPEYAEKLYGSSLVVFENYTIIDE